MNPITPEIERRAKIVADWKKGGKTLQELYKEQQAREKKERHGILRPEDIKKRSEWTLS